MLFVYGKTDGGSSWYVQDNDCDI